MTANVKILNTNDLLEKNPLVLCINGIDHVRVDPTVNMMLEMMQDLEAQRQAPNSLAEFEFIIRIICRSFPSITREMIGGWPLDAVNKIYDMARGGEVDEAVSEGAGGNEKPAN